MKTVSIILARGGSKGLFQKNIADFCGKPLLAWTIEHCLNGGVKLVYVSSDSDSILQIAKDFGAIDIKRPESLSGDQNDSESGWLHALDFIESEHGIVDWVLAPQVTSPIRSPEDISGAIKMVESGQYDSIFSVVPVTDFFMWKKNESGQIKPINYDYHNRKLRQNISTTYLENGSFYLFRPSMIRANNNRLSGRIGMFVMSRYKMFQIDNKEDFELCEVI